MQTRRPCFQNKTKTKNSPKCFDLCCVQETKGYMQSLVGYFRQYTQWVQNSVSVTCPSHFYSFYSVFHCLILDRQETPGTTNVHRYVINTQLNKSTDTQNKNDRSPPYIRWTPQCSPCPCVFCPCSWLERWPRVNLSATSWTVWRS